MRMAHKMTVLSSGSAPERNVEYSTLNILRPVRHRTRPIWIKWFEKFCDDISVSFGSRYCKMKRMGCLPLLHLLKYSPNIYSYLYILSGIIQLCWNINRYRNTEINKINTEIHKCLKGIIPYLREGFYSSSPSELRYLAGAHPALGYCSEPEEAPDRKAGDIGNWTGNRNIYSHRPNGRMPKQKNSTADADTDASPARALNDKWLLSAVAVAPYTAYRSAQIRMTASAGSNSCSSSQRQCCVWCMASCCCCMVGTVGSHVSRGLGPAGRPAGERGGYECASCGTPEQQQVVSTVTVSSLP